VSDKATITITVDRQSYAPGGNVTGLVRIETPDALKINKVDVMLEWKTSGKGDKDSAQIDVQEIVKGGQIDGLVEVPYSLMLPAAPCSYHGRLIKIEWCVKVRIDRPWAFDIYGEWPFVVSTLG